MTPWRTKVEASHPEWLPFLEAVADRAAGDALAAGDAGRASREILADQAAAVASVLLFGVEFMDATRSVEAIERRDGLATSTAGNDLQQIAETLRRLREDPALLDAFQAKASLLPSRTRSAVLSAVEEAGALEPLHPPTRSRLKLNAREAGPAITAALEARLAPVWKQIRALEERFSRLSDGDEWKLEGLLAERDRLLEAVAKVEREILADALVEETPDGRLVRIHSALEAFRSRGHGEEA
ncbi:MAG TPA: hypothetical protein VMM12_05455 [Longimicrobiales bacterium]|nr:hypothetical protein [Longimicrobiales bacterium]